MPTFVDEHKSEQTAYKFRQQQGTFNRKRLYYQKNQGPKF